MDISSFPLAFKSNLCHVTWTWTLFFKLSQILSLIQVLTSNYKKHDYNNLTFEVHAKKIKKIMNQKIYIYYPDKIINLLVFFFRDPNILLLTLLFVYILPCFHPIRVFFVVVFAWCHHYCCCLYFSEWQGTSPPSCVVQFWDIRHGMHIGLRPLAFDHVCKINALFFFSMLILIFF
jgi:hypothetical protein